MTDSPNEVKVCARNNDLFFFKIRQLPTHLHSFRLFEEIYQKLKASVDLESIDLIFAEYIESLPLIYFMRRDGFYCPAIIIPHTNPYPLNVLSYFLLIFQYCHPNDIVLCGSRNAAEGYRRMLGINAIDIPTFGVKQLYQPVDQGIARERLGLPTNKRIILYTGRIAPDKGILELLDVYDQLQKENASILLVISATHIDTDYFNRLAPSLKNTIFYYRLPLGEMVYLYGSSDLFVSTATSVFETYGKSPLEAISCGTRVVLPKWDGFPSYVENWNGMLANVKYGVTRPDSQFGFATVDTNDFVEKCLLSLEKGRIIHKKLPQDRYYSYAINAIQKLVDQQVHAEKALRTEKNKEFNTSSLDPSIHLFLSAYGIANTQDILNHAGDIISQNDPGEESILRPLHDQLFMAMTSI